MKTIPLKIVVYSFITTLLTLSYVHADDSQTSETLIKGNRLPEEKVVNGQTIRLHYEKPSAAGGTQAAFRPIQLEEDGSYEYTLPLAEKGVTELSLRLTPNLQDNPEEGTLIDVTGTVIAFEPTGDDGSYRVIALGVNPENEVDWLTLMRVGPSGLTWLNERALNAYIESRDRAGLPLTLTSPVKLRLLIDAEKQVWTLGQSLREDYKWLPMVIQGKTSQITISNGQGAQTLIRSIDLNESAPYSPAPLKR